MPRTLVVGDSLGVGTAPTLQRLLHGRVDADTRVGRSSREGVSHLKRALAQHTYDRIVFDLGTNDASADATRRSLSRAKRIAGATPIFAATVNGPDAARKNAAIRKAGVNVVDWASRSVTGSDGIHSTPSGYAKRARMFQQAMRGAPRAPTSLPFPTSRPNRFTRYRGPVTVRGSSAPQMPDALAIQSAPQPTQSLGELLRDLQAPQ